MLIAIKANDAIEKLDGVFSELSGSAGLKASKFKDIFLVADLIYRNCRFYEKDSDEAFQRFMQIMQDEELTVAEKCIQLVS